MLAITLATTLMSTVNAPNLDQICQEAFVRTQAALPNEKLQPGDVAITVLQLDRSTLGWRSGHYQGDTGMFPASVVKLFWLVFLAHEVDQGRITLTPEIERAARDMIVISGNDATGAIVNLTTKALPGPELSGSAYSRWRNQRMAANRWFQGLGYENINVLNRTYNEGPYGREKQIIDELGRNRLTANASARLMAEIALDKIVQRRCAWMKEMLRRDIPADNPKADSQTFGFLGEVMPSGTQHWSKAGWTSQVRHDVSWNLMPDGREFVFCVFTLRPNNKLVLQTAAMEVLRGLGYSPNAPRTGPD